MKLLLFFTFIFSLSVASHAQVKKYFPLKEENVDYAQLTDDNLIQYKLSTTKPLTAQTEIDGRYVIKNFDWRKIIPNMSGAMRKFGERLNNNLKMREPLKGENPNFAYFEAVIGVDSLPLMMYTNCTVPLEQTEDGEFIANEVTNLHGINLYFTSKLNDVHQKKINFGRTCSVTTIQNGDLNNVNFTIAVELDGYRFDDIASGNVEINIGGFKEPDRTVIRKSDVGKDVLFDNRVFNIIEFDKGVVHLRFLKKKYNVFEKYNYVGNLNGNKFNIKCSPNLLMLAVYNRYRESKESYDKIMVKAASKKKVDFDVADFEYDVAIYHLGYDVDSMDIYVQQKPLSTMLTHAISVRKTDENYAFNTIVIKNSNPIDTRLMNDYISNVREYFRKYVRYPQYAQDNGVSGIVNFKFLITPDGRITDVEILSSPDNSLSEEVRRLVRNAPLFNLGLVHPIIGSMKLQFTL